MQESEKKMKCFWYPISESNTPIKARVEIRHDIDGVWC